MPEGSNTKVPASQPVSSSSSGSVDGGWNRRAEDLFSTMVPSSCVYHLMAVEVEKE